MPNEKNKSTKGDIKFDKIIILTKTERGFCIGVALFALIAPLLFTRKAWFFDVSFVDTGQIGDTIGGISAPFIGLVGAFLVYKSFEAQIKANHQQQINHYQQLKLIRKEQSLSAISYLFKEIEIIVNVNEEKFKNGSVAHISKYLLNVKNSEGFKENPNYESYLKKTEKQSAIQIGKAVDVLYENTMHLRVLVNHISDYSLTYKNENNTIELTHFYTSKIYKLINQLKLNELNQEPIQSLETVIRFNDEFKLLTFKNCQLNTKDLYKKTNELSFSAFFG